jgi:hypothetical protein
MYIDPVLMITSQQAELERAGVEAERRRVATERRAAEEADIPLRNASDRPALRRLFRKTVEN